MKRYPNSPCFLKEGNFLLELKRGDRARVQTEMVEFMALPFLFSNKLKKWSFHTYFTSQLCRDSKEMYKKACCTCRVVVLLIKPIAFLTFPCRRRRSFVRSLVCHVPNLTDELSYGKRAASESIWYGSFSLVRQRC